MGNIFDFSEIEKSEETIKRTWAEFRKALALGQFRYDEVKKAKKYTFLKVYDDLFNQHFGIIQNTTTIANLKSQKIGRGAILNVDELPNFERFIPKKEFIRDENRFSPPGTEWLYLSLGAESDIHVCAQAECRGKKGNRFGFCYFELDSVYDDCKLVDLTIADEVSFNSINRALEKYGRIQVEKAKTIAIATGIIPPIDKMQLEKELVKWSAVTHTKFLSEQIFIPLDVKDNRKIEYSPFQTMAQYFISLGYSGIIYGSTVSSVGKNVVLFNKKMASPSGPIEIRIIS